MNRFTLPGRRQVLRILGGAGVGLLARGVPGHSTAPPDEPKNRPNILFIIPDDLGWMDVGYHGSRIRTPHIDRLAREGRIFTHHYVAPTCTPTRVGLFTGRYPSRFGVTAPAYGNIFDPGTVTLASTLAECGYYTALSGKWHMGSPPECVPRKYGFQSSYGYFHGQIDPYTHLYKTGERSWHRNDRFFQEEGHATDLITQEAVRVIESHPKDQPFFLYVAYSVPHFPLNEPEEWLDLYRDTFEDPSRRWFAAGVTHMDDGIGQILAALDRAGQRENTLIVFVSDNGGQRKWHNTKQYDGRYADKPHTALGDNRPLRGWKGDLYEGGIRVPAFVNWGNHLKPGKIETPVHVVDWMPTLCDLTGCTPETKPNWDGENVWPVVRAEGAPVTERTFYWKTPTASAIRKGDWKLIFFRKENRLELYNVTEDPTESRNLADEKPDFVNTLKSLMERIALQDRDEYSTGARNLKP